MQKGSETKTAKFAGFKGKAIEALKTISKTVIARILLMIVYLVINFGIVLPVGLFLALTLNDYKPFYRGYLKQIDNFHAWLK